MTPRAPRFLLVLAACAGLGVSLGAASLQPDPAKPQPDVNTRIKPDDSARTGQPDRAGVRERLRERCTRALAEMRDDQAKLEEAMKKLDAGASIDEIRAALPERLAARFRAGNEGPPIEGEPGPGNRRGGDRADRPDRGDRFGPGGPGGGGINPNQPFSEQDWEAVNAIIKHAQPEMLDKFNELRQKDPDEAQKGILAAYPRLRPLLELYKHDREAFDFRLEELVILRKSLPLAKNVLDLKKSGKADDSDEVKAAREKLRDLGKRQYENRLKIQRHELAMMGERMQRRQKDLDEQAADPERGVERSIDGLIKMAERGWFDRGRPGDGPGPNRRGDRPPPEGGRRPPGDDSN
jgi:hypothetical protein